jgi:hypothetical protein
LIRCPDSAAALVTGTSIYLGADDNLDTGEHDGVNGQDGTANSVNGPSDGGALVVNRHPLDVMTWMAAVAADPTVALTKWARTPGRRVLGRSRLRHPNRPR